ncbi:hypothetical protein [Salinispora arenicola]|uniref:hypothetical protein n=1 Tax=Salinispora arenicola TaxID=168697 RepID=UPI0003A7F789|nr:hypothetical protein [Salinispora arenicola]
MSLPASCRVGLVKALTVVPDRRDLRGVARTRAARPRAATTPDGTPVTIHDTVLTARRTR